MTGVTPSSFGRIAAFVAITSAGAWLFSGAPAQGQPATPSSPKPAPTTTSTAPSAAPSVGASPAARSPAPPARKPSREECERYVSVLAGREKDPAVLKQEDVKAMVAPVADLVTCGAVRADSDEPCALIKDASGDQCRETRALFHELRVHPKGRAFMFDEHEFEKCKGENALMAPVCETIRKAIMAGDPNQCVINADFESICRNVHGDVDVASCAKEAPRVLEAHCRAKIRLDESACDVPGSDKKMAEECRRDIRARKAYGKGLKELVTSGAPREKELAKAALDDPDACKAFSQPVMKACLAGGPAAAPATTTTTSPKR